MENGLDSTPAFLFSLETAPPFHGCYRRLSIAINYLIVIYCKSFNSRHVDLVSLARFSSNFIFSPSTIKKMRAHQPTGIRHSINRNEPLQWLRLVQSGSSEYAGSWCIIFDVWKRKNFIAFATLACKPTAASCIQLTHWQNDTRINHWTTHSVLFATDFALISFSFRGVHRMSY